MDRPIGHLITAELLSALKTLYPLRAPHPDTPDRRIWMAAGQQQLIEFLQSQHDDAIIQPILSE